MASAYRSYERDLSDGLCDYERAVLARWDAGATIAAIAEATGQSARQVQHVVSLYDDRPDADARGALERANARHVAAIRRVRAKPAPVRTSRPKPPMIDASEIEAMLKDRAESVVYDIFPHAEKRGDELCVGSLAGDKGQSLRVNVGGGERRGWWRDFNGAEQDKGDMLWLIAKAMFRGDLGKAFRWARSWLGIDDGDPGRIEQHRLEARANAEKRKAEGEAERARRIAGAHRRWLQAKPFVRGDAVDRYLLGRAIDCARLRKFPGALRLHPALSWGYRGPQEPGIKLPAMVAMVTALDGSHIATHRTWLSPATGGKAGEADGLTGDAKMAMGFPLGGFITLSKGRHRCMLKDIPAGADVYASEGIEDGLTGACALPDDYFISFVSLSYLEALQLPAQIGRLIIVAQNDPPGSPAAKKLPKAVAALRGRGVRVLLAPPPKGVKDINELAQGVVA